MKMNIYIYVKDAGDKTYSPKPQYTKGGYVFQCPFCGKEINSHQYLNIQYWERACEKHIDIHLRR